MEWGLLIALVLSAEPARFPKGLAPMKLPAPPAALKSWSDAECAGCHRAEAQEHALSGHAVARSSFVFQAGAKDEQPAWCVGCHAPLASSFATREPQGPSPEEAGIGCAACHAGERGKESLEYYDLAMVMGPIDNPTAVLVREGYEIDGRTSTSVNEGPSYAVTYQGDVADAIVDFSENKLSGTIYLVVWSPPSAGPLTLKSVVSIDMGDKAAVYEWKVKS